MHLYHNGRRIADVFDLARLDDRKWAFACRPPIFIADEDYEIFPPGGRPMRIIISEITSDGVQSHIQALEP